MKNMLKPYSTLLFQNQADYTARASFTSEASIINRTSNPDQPQIPDDYLIDRKALLFEAGGIVGCTGTPTYIFQVRMGSVAGHADLTGASLGVSAAITMQSGVSNRMWYLRLKIVCNTFGHGTNGLILNCYGFVECFDGFASPFRYPLSPTTPPTATWTDSTSNGALKQYFNLSATCSASSASNSITTKDLSLTSLN